VGLLHPHLLWFGALAVPLVLLYVLKVRREDHTVSSTWLWETSLREIAAQVPFRRLRRDWLLLLQLLILALAVLAAAGPYRRTLVEPGERTALVLDASAGMTAGDRFEEARRTALAAVAGMGAGDEVLVLRAGPRPAVLAPLTSDRRALREAVLAAVPSPAPADLEEAVRLARRILGEGGSVVLLTDGAGPAPEAPGLRVVRVGGPLDNSGIVAFGVRPANPSGSDHEVFVRVRNASADEVRGALRLELDGRLRDATTLRVPAGGRAEHTLRLDGVREGRIEVVWEPPGPEALGLDDRALWVLRPPEPRRYRFQGEPGPYLRRALAADPDWAEAEPGRPADLEVVVRRPPSEEGPPFLWIDPPELREGLVEGAVVLDWDRAHPALRFVDLHTVRLGRVPRLRRPPGARVLAESSAGPMILEGSRGGRSYLLWAFEPMETDLPLRAAFPLLVRNAAERLAPPGGGLPGGLPTGASPEVPWPWGDPVQLVAPDRSQAPLASAGGRLRLPPLEQAGVWRIAGAGREIRFAASLLDDEESDLRPRAGPGGETAAPRRAAAGMARAALRGLWRPLALLAVALLLLESAAFHRKWTP